MAEPLNATFFAFRKREQSGVLLRASLAFVIVAAVLISGFVGLFWTSVVPAIEWYGSIISAAATNDSEAIANTAFPTGVFGMFFGLFVWMFFFYILCASYEAACLRWMIHGEVAGFMGLSLGAPTWRVWGVYWIWFLLYMALSMVMSIVMMVLMGMLAMNSGGDPTAMLTVIPVYYVLQYGIMTYFGVRFAPAASTTIARRRFAFFDAWKVTNGRFWALFGAFALLWLVYVVVSVVLSGVWFTVALSAAPPDWAALSDPERANEAFGELVQAYGQSLMQPQSWAILGVLSLVGSIIAVTFYVAMYGINARAAQAALDEGKIQAAA